jgi:hypothetical protein
MRTNRWVALIVSVAVVGVSATAYAALTSGSGGGFVRTDYRTENAPNTYSGAFAPLPGAIIGVAVPAGATRLLTARFTAESRCTGAANAWCSARVMVKLVNGAAQEMQPVAGLDFAFDSVGSDGLEGHAMTRHLRVPAGQYNVYVERATTNAATTFRLDDWDFEVNQNV